MRHARRTSCGEYIRRVQALAVIAALSMGVAQYSPAASWFSDWRMRGALLSHVAGVAAADAGAVNADLLSAQQWNADLAAGALPLTDDMDPVYVSLLRSAGSDTMAILEIPAIGLAGPVLHGSTDDVLSIGLGHFYGSSLPVGGPSTHAGITGHSGLISATMFTNLPKVVAGDEFTVTTLGRRMWYQVTEIQQVRAEAAWDLIEPIPGRDLVTLVTCTPIGVNTHRLLVTGERMADPPDADADMVTFWQFPGFPWWAAWWVGAITSASLVGRCVLLPRWRRQDARAGLPHVS